MPRRIAQLFFCLLLLFSSAGCGAPPGPSIATPALPDTLIFYDWENDVPQSVLDAFEKEFGIKVEYRTYISQDEALANVRSGENLDVVVMESRYIPLLISEGRLAKLNHSNLPNFRNISPNFRNLIYDPNNQFCVPYSWGTTGLLVRTDTSPITITQWADLWNPVLRGRIGIWLGQEQEMIGVALKSLGYTTNTNDITQLNQARDRLVALAPHVKFTEDYNEDTAADIIASGDVDVAVGYAYDFIAASEANPSVKFILPKEGALLWGDTFAIPLTTQNQAAAELLINYLLRDDVNAEVMNFNHYATANEKAQALINTRDRLNPVIYPPEEKMLGADIILPVSSETQRIHEQIWQAFLKAAGR
jgi:spermidine/putrescine transport system substrate-binding protein